MKSAYNERWVNNLSVIKETKRWAEHHFITTEQFLKIKEEYKTPLYHPNFIIRILLFIATSVAVSGVTGIMGLIVAEANNKAILWGGCAVYGIGAFIVLEKALIANNHFKSGVTESILYHACAFTVCGIAGLNDFDSPQLLMLSCLVVSSWAAFRYLDLISTVVAMGSLASILFYNCMEAGGILKQLIPFVFIIAFSVLYFLVLKVKSKPNSKNWSANLITVEIICLLLIYISGNYLVVRELSVDLMGLDLNDGENIPFAFLFYGLTVALPIAYLFYGIRNKDVVLLRVSLLLIAFSVFTFKYYYRLGHTEIMLLFSGLILSCSAIGLMRYLKVVRNGFTGENLFSSKWAALNAEAFIISQTMGGNQVPKTEEITTGGGGSFGGGGSTESF
jgi:hypothetical protein